MLLLAKSHIQFPGGIWPDCRGRLAIGSTFDTSDVVVLDNSNLKIATSRNYHHFFPRSIWRNIRKTRSRT